jgi:hypothetical protein
MRRRLLLSIVLAALIAAGCGSDRSTAFDLSTDTGGESGAGVGAAKLAGGATLVLAAAETTAAVTDVRISMTAEMGGLPEFDGAIVSFSMEAAIAGDGSRGQLVVDFGDLMAVVPVDDLAGLGAAANMISEPIEMRFADHMVYVSSGFIDWLFPVDTPWVAFPAESDTPGDVGFDTDALSVAELMMVLKGMEADPEVVGREMIDGVDTTHVRGRFSAERLAELGGEFDLGGFDLGGFGLDDFDPTGLRGTEVDGLDVDVWIGDDDLVRRLRFGLDDLSGLDTEAPGDAFVSFTIDFSDIGRPVVVDIPPASEVTVLGDIFG